VPSHPPPRIAIPMPHSADREYAERAIPQYERAVKLAGGEAVRIPLDLAPAEIMQMIKRCDGALLPASKADVNPAKFGASRSPHTADADPRRDRVDELLLRDAYNLRKPILGICYGLQSLNVYRNGSLIQHIPDFLPGELRTCVNHEAGKSVGVAHAVEIESDSRLAEVLCGESRPPLPRRAQFGGGSSAPDGGQKLVLGVNSSHHQSADAIGNGLGISARCLEDGIIEALEGTRPDHFVLAVQWHPERSMDEDEASPAIFRALVKAAQTRPGELKGDFDSVK